MPDEAPVTDPPPPVLVTPIPASRSRTMWLGNLLATIGGVLAMLPELASDPSVVAYMDEFMSPSARRSVGIAVFVLGFVLRHLRKNTSAPIIGTLAAMPQDQRVNTPTDGGGRV